MQIANKRIFSDYLKRFQLNKPSSKSFHGAASSSNNNLVDFNKDLILLHDSKVIVKERPTISLLESSDDWYEYINYTSQPLIVAFFARCVLIHDIYIYIYIMYISLGQL